MDFDEGPEILKTPLFNSQLYKKPQEYFLLPLLPSCDIKTNVLFTGFGFSERCRIPATSNLYKTRAKV